MAIKVTFVMLFSLLLFTNVVSLNGHRVLSSNDLGRHGNEHFGFRVLPRKLLLDPKVEGAEYKDLVSYKASSGESRMREEEAMQEGSEPTRVFTMDYTGVRKRRPVHNKSFPTGATSP